MQPGGKFRRAATPEGSCRVWWGRLGDWNEQPEAAPLGERTIGEPTWPSGSLHRRSKTNPGRYVLRSFLECGRGVIVKLPRTLQGRAGGPFLVVVHFEEASRW